MNKSEKEMRVVYAETLNELMATDPDVVCVEADLSKASGTNPLVRQANPARFINCGVSEANMISLAAGLAKEGKKPFCATFSCFAARRVYDQVTISVAYANNNVKIVGTAPGVTQGPNGGTHMCFQDMAIMRAMPNMRVFSPADPHELKALMKYLAASNGPAYLQLVRPQVNLVFDESYAFNPDRAVVVRTGGDVTLVSTGYMTSFAVQAAAELAEKGVAVELLHYASVKPFDQKTLIASAQKTRGVVTVENQSTIGGLGGAVGEVLGENCPTRMKRLGVPDCFGEVAGEEYLFNKHGFGLKHIVATCAEMAAMGRAEKRRK